MVQRTRESLVLFLIIVLPFHALLVTVGTRLLVGAGQAPLPWLAVWKEVFLGFVLLIAVIEIFWGCKRMYQYTRVLVYPFVDLLDWFVLGLIVLGLAVPSSNFIFGFKYTLFPLCLFLVLRRVSWSEEFKQRVLNVILVVGGVVAGYGIITLFLPQSFFTVLGYSDLHSLYLPDGPLAAFQQIGNTALRRMQSTFSGPNQLGVWLLIPWSITMSALQKPPHSHPLPWGEGKTPPWLFVLFGVVILLTFSRAAWVGAAVIVLAALLMRGDVMVSSSNHTSPFDPFESLRVALSSTPRSLRLEERYSKGDRLRVTYSVWLAPGWRVVAGLILCSLGIALWLSPRILLRPESSLEHLRRPLVAIQTIVKNPLGLGLGSAGPASNRVSDSCVFLEAGSDVSWAKDRSNLCVFVGGTQIQPTSRACRCPLLPENWYLQVGVELGIVGFFLFVALTLVLLWRLLQATSYKLPAIGLLTTNYSLLTFIGISVAALFLHAWEDSAVAYTVWILIAATLPTRRTVRFPHLR